MPDREVPRVRSTRSVALAIACATAFAGSPAHADDKREVPDYDGRGNQDAEAGSWVLWIPRIALSPLYVVNEYVLRKPLGALVTKAERERWADTVSDLFTFGPSQNYLLIPTALFDFGLLPSIGLYFSGDDVWTPHNSVRVHVATGGASWFTATALDRYSWDHGGRSLSLRFEYTRRPDYLFVGIGPDITDDTRSRYGLQKIEVSSSYHHRLFGESSASVWAGVRSMAYRPGDCCGDPSLDQRIADGSLMRPPGYNTPYAVAFQRGELVFDSRPPRPAPGTGIYLRLHGESDIDLHENRKWIEYGAVAGTAFDLDGRQRTIKLQIGADFVDPVTGEVPFNELVPLGSYLMPGFIDGWMLGRSMFVAQAGYTWPIWVWLDGQLRFAVGNAFDQHLDELSIKKLRMSADLGLTSNGSRDSAFELLIGVGTETFEQGASITSTRITVGSRRGF